LKLLPVMLSIEKYVTTLARFLLLANSPGFPEKS
jgi:hypothetical protein